MINKVWVIYISRKRYKLKKPATWLTGSIRIYLIINVMAQKVIYRYELDSATQDYHAGLKLRRYTVVKETAKTYFIINPKSPSKLKQVRKVAAKTFAYDTKEKALKHYINRTNTRIRWYEYWVANCRVGLDLAENIGSRDSIDDEDGILFDKYDVCLG